MATRHLTPIAQYREPRDTTASAIIDFGFLVLDDEGSYMIDADGPADGILVDDGEGSLVIATSGTAIGKISAPAGTENYTLYR
jgi:hypothetical protein